MHCANCGGWNLDNETFCRSCLQRLDGAGWVFVGEYAGFWERYAALFVDSLLLLLVTVPVAVGLELGGKKMGMADSPAYAVASSLLPWALSAAYFILMESGERGATFGKRWLNIRVINTEGARIGPGRALGRYVAHLLSDVTLIGYLIQPFTEDKQALHDMVSGTVVVKTDDDSNTLAIVLAVIASILGAIALAGVVAAVAIPAYQDYVVKAKVEKAAAIGTAATKAVDNFYAQTGRFPVSIAEARVTVQRPAYISYIEINPTSGAVQVVFGNNQPRSVAGKALTFEPSRSEGGQYLWTCSGGDIPPNLLPQACK